MAYSLNNFLGPFTNDDKLLKIYNSQGLLDRTIDPFKIVTSISSNNLVILKTRSSSITLDFATSTEAKLALEKIQGAITTLTTSKPPLFIDKYISNYVSLVGSTSSQGSLNTTPGATATNVIYDFENGTIWYHATASTDYSANFINIPTNNNKYINASIIISQGATGYSPISIKIDGITQSVKWLSGTYSISTNKVDIIEFTFLRSSNTWVQVFGQINSFS